MNYEEELREAAALLERIEGKPPSPLRGREDIEKELLHLRDLVRSQQDKIESLNGELGEWRDSVASSWTETNRLKAALATANDLLNLYIIKE